MIKNLFFLLLFLFLLVGCSNKEDVNIVKKPEIINIEIGIVGEIPTLIKDKSIKF